MAAKSKKTERLPQYTDGRNMYQQPTGDPRGEQMNPGQNHAAEHLHPTQHLHGNQNNIASNENAGTDPDPTKDTTEDTMN
jgi:hypothetical protein